MTEPEEPVRPDDSLTLERYRAALLRIANAESGHWGHIARDALAEPEEDQQSVEVEIKRLRDAVTYALSIIRDACEDLDDDGRQATASALHTAHERLAGALTGEQPS